MNVSLFISSGNAHAYKSTRKWTSGEDLGATKNDTLSPETKNDLRSAVTRMEKLVHKH